MTVIAEEKETARKIRKYRNLLYIMGSGVIALGLWNALRTILMIINTPWILITPEMAEASCGDSIVIIGVIFTLVFTAAFLSVYLYVGKKAREAGLGKKKKPFYIAVIIFLALVHVFSVIYCILAIAGIVTVETENVLSLIVSMIVDTTAAVTLVEMCCSAVMLRKYERGNAGNG